MRLNKRGQTLVLFIILIPILLGLGALVVDMGVIMASKAHLREVTIMVIKENLDCSDTENKIKKLLVKNDISVDNLEIEFIDDKLNIKNEIEINSVFGSIVGIKNYQIKVDITGYKENEKVIIE